MRTIAFASACAALLFCACGGHTESSDAPAAPEAAKAQEAARRIHKMEQDIWSGPSFDLKEAQSLVDVYLAYAKDFPIDSLTPGFLFNAANAKKNLGDPRGSVQLYDRIIANYPNWPRTPDCYYLKAFVLDDALHELGAAKTAYEIYINKFPDHTYVKDAKASIANLGMDPLELVHKFERQNAADSARAAK